MPLMETSSSSLSVPLEPSNYDEIFMNQALLFSDSLKDLKNLRSQLYTAAEYFEASYRNDDQNQTVVNTLKDYTVNALVNTVDHLGSVSFKVNGLMDENVEEISATEFRLSCIEQRLRTCQKYIDHEGLTQQSLVITTPKYHKRYVLPDGETKPCSGQTISKYEGSSLQHEINLKHWKNAIRATINNPPPSIRKGRSPSPTSRSSARNFSFTDKQQVSEKRTTSPTPQSSLRPGHLSFEEKQQSSEKRSTSPKRSKFPLLRSGSLAIRSASSKMIAPLPNRSKTPVPSRSTTTLNSNTDRRYPSEPRKSFSMRLPADNDNPKDVEHHPSKSKRLLKVLLSRRKSKKDASLYTFLDEY